MNFVILYRKGMDPDADQVEIQAASKHFVVTHQRACVEPGELVIGRMSVLPFYRELEIDINYKQSILINTYRQHQFIADMKEWVPVLGDMTPRLYERIQDVPEGGPYVVKGETNSRKFNWDTHMFAKDKAAVGVVASRLMDDGLFKDQQIYARNYVPLVKLAEGFNGLPITEEYRFFVCYDQIVAGSFYWASHAADLETIPSPDNVPREFLQEAIKRIGDRANFYALDVARTQDGNWIVVEINDGQMSGLSMIDADVFYERLKAIIMETPVTVMGRG